LSSSSAAQFRRRYLAVTYMQGSIIPAGRMAVATLTCVSGCSCTPVQLVFGQDTNNGIAATEVRLPASAMLVLSQHRMRVAQAWWCAPTTSDST
jgi:hypothetical protein